MDFDQHEGDGSQDIIDKLGLGERIVHRTGKLHYPRQKEFFFDKLPALLESMRGADIIFYQAGADQHKDDPLGGFLDGDDLRTRDRAVFGFAKLHGIPIVWNLAGGYQETVVDGVRSIQKILDIHGATMQECIRAFAVSSAPVK